MEKIIDYQIVDYADFAHCFNCKNFKDNICLIKTEINSQKNKVVEPTSHCIDFEQGRTLSVQEYEKEVAAKKVLEVSENIKEAAKAFTKDYIDFGEDFFNIQPFFYDDVGTWWIWNIKEKYWSIIDETSLLNQIYGACKENGIRITLSSTKAEMLTSLKMVGRKHKPEDAPTKWIQFKDKAFSLKSSNEYEVTYDYFFTNPIPWEIGINSSTPTLDKLFQEWVGKKYVRTLYEIIAYCCYTDYPIQVLFCLFGNGRNGKTCFLKILRKFLGFNNLSSTDLDLLVGHNRSRFEVFKLYKKLACLMGETNFNLLQSSSTLKKLTGGDLIGFEMKGKNPFDDYNYAKIIIASNSLPSSEDTSEGFYRRWVIIDFPNQFKEGKDITNSIPDYEYNSLACKVCKLLPKLLEKGEFTNQGSVEERKERYIMASNPLPLFIKSFCYQDPQGYVRYSKLYHVYTQFLTHTKRRVVTKKEFSRVLLSEGFENRKTSKDGEVDYWVEGLKFKEDFPDFPDFQEFYTNPLHGELIWDLKKSGKSGKKEYKNHTSIQKATTEFEDFVSTKIPEEWID